MSNEALLSVRQVDKHFDISGGFLDQLKWRQGRPARIRTMVKAVNQVSFDIRQGETLSVVGESGCGKSTLGRVIIGLYQPSTGQVHYRGRRIDTLTSQQMLKYRTKMQMVFQDPYASLNPRMKVRETLEEPLRFHNKNGGQRQNQQMVRDRVAEVMRQVGVDPAWMDRYPHEFSGGQRQRISIARALVVDPEFVVADEPISALDVSIQAQILNLLMDAQEQRGLTYLFISHDLSVVRHISSRVAVMYLGTLCEVAPTENLFKEPRHPYTRALLSAIPRLGGQCGSHVRLSGEVPTPIDLPPGCVFHGRCPAVHDICRQKIPRLRELESGTWAACHGLTQGWI
ncbi:MAG: ATP-binding cassette domain-containing protein [Desulfarculaceae bacterium]|jgi:peptide/nickel transport system ATP-binding protein